VATDPSIDAGSTLDLPLASRSDFYYSHIMPVTDSPLRYPGGKTQLAPFVVDLIHANSLQSCVYAEPFAGGAGLGWKLLYGGYVSELWLNDIDPAIYSLWKAALDQPDELCEKLRKTRISMAEWHRQKQVFANKRSRILDLAFATLFLNRTNRSGILSGGVIGGMDQKGKYKLGCRFNKDELENKIQRIASYREVVKVTRMDAKLCIPLWGKTLPKRALMNIDPPYFAQGQELYTNFYTPENHAQLATIIRRLKSNWMLTYDDAPEIQRLYAGLPVYRKGLVYYAQVKRRANELLVLAPNLASPPRLRNGLRVAA
jgi:DNA adenine methylase